MNAKVICTFNNQEIFNQIVKNNENLKNCEFFEYDNTVNNVPITKNYNDFIKNNDLSEDFWCIFIHQDFGLSENIQCMLNKLDKNFIYGAIGVKMFKGLFFGKKDKEGNLGFKNTLTLTLGQISQGNNDFSFKKHGRKVFFQPTVDSIDCCCIIMHSSLIKKHNLLFDENLNFHMYAEELCYSAKKNHGIKTKVQQMKCFHLGKGCLNADFEKSAQYLKEKFNIKKIPSTCPN